MFPILKIRKYILPAFQKITQSVKNKLIVYGSVITQKVGALLLTDQNQ